MLFLPFIFWVRVLVLNIDRNELTELKWNCGGKETRKGVDETHHFLSIFFTFTSHICRQMASAFTGWLQSYYSRVGSPFVLLDGQKLTQEKCNTPWPTWLSAGKHLKTYFSLLLKLRWIYYFRFRKKQTKSFSLLNHYVSACKQDLCNV